jgi:SAM-dependent methyltransferase
MCRVPESNQGHWEHLYRTRPPDEVSWFQAEPATSVRLIEAAVSIEGSVLDVGAGASVLVDALVAAGFADLTVLDLSQRALDAVRERLGERTAGVELIHDDLLRWVPGRTFDVWHDRAVYHFLTHPRARARYLRVLEAAVPAGGTAIIATFASDGPTHCSGLPVSRYDATGLAAQFRSSFDLVHTECERHRTPAGVVQPFTWVVLRHR